MPGDYWPDQAYMDYDTVFLEPSLIDGAIETLIKNTNERFKTHFYNPFLEGCRFCEELIKIHPFEILMADCQE